MPSVQQARSEGRGETQDTQPAPRCQAEPQGPGGSPPGTKPCLGQSVEEPHGVVAGGGTGEGPGKENGCDLRARELEGFRLHPDAAYRLLDL